MPNNQWRVYQALSLIAAATLSAWPVPDWLAPWQPQWIMMTLIFWAVTRPGEAEFGMAWVFGLLSDLVSGNWLGLHVIICCIIVFLCTRLHRALQLSDAMQRFLPVALLLALHIGYLQLLSMLLSNINPGFVHWGSLVTSLLFWPLLYYLLYKVQNRRKAAL